MSSQRLSPNRADIERTARLLIGDSSVIEIRALGVSRPGYRAPHTESGYFDYPTALADAAMQIEQAKGIYCTMNPANSALHSRAFNRIKPVGRGDGTTSDADIVQRRVFALDFDPRRPSGISATEEEKRAADERMRAVSKDLSELGWPSPVVADSGNGYHLLYRIDLACDDGGLVKACLDALATVHGDDIVAVDTTLHNPARILKLYGTVACKGDHTETRPHRVSKLIRVPDEWKVVPIELLRALAGRVASDDNVKKRESCAAIGSVRTFDVERFIREHLPDAEGPRPWREGGRVWTLPECPFNPAHNRGEAFITERADGNLGAGCHHNSCEWHWKDLRELFEPKIIQNRQTKTLAGSSSNGTSDIDTPDERPGPVVISAASIEPKEIRWLWPQRIARGKATLLVGDPGIGKSFLTIDFASRISTGSGWPDRRGELFDPGDVLLMSAEDDPADTIIPRLMSAGADRNRVHILRGVRTLNEYGERCEVLFDLSRDIYQLRAAIGRLSNPMAVIVDPIAAFMGTRIDSRSNTEVRSVLSELSRLAEDLSVAVVAVTHLRKSAGPAIYRSIDSLAFIAQARAAYGVVRDQDDPSAKRRLVLPIKNNIGNDTDGLAYELAPTQLGVPHVRWEPNPVEINIDEAMSESTKPGPQAVEREQAELWLQRALMNGPRPATEMLEEGKQGEGFSESTIKRARRELGVKACRPEVPGPWHWRLPHHPEPTTVHIEPDHLDPLGSGDMRGDPIEGGTRDVTKVVQEGQDGRVTTVRMRPDSSAARHAGEECAVCEPVRSGGSKGTG